MIQKKVCMVGAFGTGKTSLVQRFIYSKFSDRYHSTVGVKIDRKEVSAGGTQVSLLLWDLAGQDKFESVQSSYLRGSAGIVFVVDGTRRESLAELAALRTLVRQTVGSVPGVVAVNKADLNNQWQIRQDDLSPLSADGLHVLTTSAKSGVGVEEAFLWLAGQMRTG